MLRAPHPVERRAFGRRESCIRAVVHIAGRPALYAIVRNYSQGGALIELPEAVDVAGQVRLVIDTHGVDVFCEVRHCNGINMGVRFQTAVAVDSLATAAGAPVELPAPVAGGELRRTLFGAGKASEDMILRQFSTPAGVVIRHP